MAKTSRAVSISETSDKLAKAMTVSPQPIESGGCGLCTRTGRASTRKTMEPW